MKNCGFIYIRENEYWSFYDAYKLGKTLNIVDREVTYITSEIQRGSYLKVIEIDSAILDEIETKLQTYFNELGLHVKFNSGTEFYKKEIVNHIFPYLDEMNVNYKILSEDEINNLIRKIRIYENRIVIEDDEDYEITYNERKYQQEIIQKSCEYFMKNDKGLLVIPCGVGKTLISLWITKRLKLNKIIIGVPNKLLLRQWKNIVTILFKNHPYCIISGGTNINDVETFMKKNLKKCIIITTYSSSHKISTLSKKLHYIFEMKINDEVHHLTTNNMELENTTKKYIEMLKISSKKQISLTATLKHIQNNDDNGDNVISNDDKDHFGEVIDKKCLLWAINENIICDYVIQTIITNYEEFEDQLLKFNVVNEMDKTLFLSAYAALKSINDGHSHHLLIYTNNRVNSLKLTEYISLLLENEYFDIPNFYYSSYNGEMKMREQKIILDNFEKSKFGIIANIYCLSEGWDFPLLDGVVFAENMTSNIRIVQSALRASRKNVMEPNKITKIILPILNKDNWLDNNENLDLKKVKEVIYQMGLEDETIEQKIKAFKISIVKNQPMLRKNFINLIEFGEYDDELTQKLRLRTVKRIAFDITYEGAKKIIAEKNIRSKDEYYKLCERDNRLSTEPELFFNEKFTSWIDYLGIEGIYYDFETCRIKINECLTSCHVSNFEFIKIIKKLKSNDDMFPPLDLWCEYYNVDDFMEIMKLIHVQNKTVEF